MIKKLLALTVLCLFCVSSTSFAAPLLINYQGNLLGSGGGPVINPALPMTFRIYDAETGGVLQWSESQTVGVLFGAFNVVLGEVTPLTQATFDNNDNLWIELQIDSDPPLSPRQRLASVPFALQANSANSVPWGGVTSIPAGFADGIDNVGITTEVDPTVNELGKAVLACSIDQVAKWDGSAWVCASGAQGPPGPPGTDGQDGVDGVDGLNCWDIDGDGVQDPGEDTNSDGLFNALDCQGADGADGADGAQGPPGPPGTDGQDGADGTDGADGLNCWDLNGDGIQDPSEDINSDGAFNALDCQGADGASGTDGLNCWDLNGDGIQDPNEDINSDGFFNTLDCKGADGLKCWDIDGDGVQDPGEDTNSDGFFNAFDCKGADGAPGADGAEGPPGSDGVPGADGQDGADGADGTDGLNCWDLNGNGIQDPSEDINSDGVFNTLDCQGSGASTGIPSNIEVFTTSGTWIRPAGVDVVYVKVWGGGGGSGANGGGSGGAGGGYAEGLIEVTGNVSVIVGQGGFAGTPPTGAGDGGTSSFAGVTTIQATGGRGGANGATAPTTNVKGGIGSGGIINLTGQKGQRGSLIGSVGGTGGNAGGGGGSGGQGAPDTAQADPGTVPGGGGGGGATGSKGQVGAAGLAIVMY